MSQIDLGGPGPAFVTPAGGHPQGMTSYGALSLQLAERWQGPSWFRWAFLGVWALGAVYVLYRLRRNGWKFPPRR
ncbi:hypothetical protein [Streptomyces sp. NPDC003435]